MSANFSSGADFKGYIYPNRCIPRMEVLSHIHESDIILRFSQGFEKPIEFLKHLMALTFEFSSPLCLVVFILYFGSC